ncbi:TRAP transporter small permease [uncultured Desulfovibrio sp.]|uniref:TRAP transporter small permease n=1 Tax=uncultured Desulfovibrio sp. TaxID=167968 RepID=UPI002804686E|nr:TRAP transporter small permease [uncultured Desulfovibrio sp.]
MNAQVVHRILNRLEGYLSEMLLVFFVCLIFVQTVLRSCFDIVLPWTEELSRFSFVWFVFLGASFAARLYAHNRVTIQFKLLPEWVGKYSLLITDIIWVIFNCMMIKMSLSIIDEMHNYVYLSPSMEISMEYVYWIFPIAFGLMNIRILQVDYIRFILKQEIEDPDKIDAESYEEIAADVAAEEQARDGKGGEPR